MGALDQTENVCAKNPVINNGHVISAVPSPLSLYVAKSEGANLAVLGENDVDLRRK